MQNDVIRAGLAYACAMPRRGFCSSLTSAGIYSAMVPNPARISLAGPRGPYSAATPDRAAFQPVRSTVDNCSAYGPGAFLAWWRDG